MRRVELASLFACVCSKVTDEVLINEAENVVVLLAISGNILDQLNKFADSLGLVASAVTEFAQTGF